MWTVGTFCGQSVKKKSGYKILVHKFINSFVNKKINLSTKN